MVDAAVVVDLFNKLFSDRYRTILSGGAQEPFYRFRPEGTSVIYFREDYLSSAMHEVAHWCIAGKRRRACDDYGYWYQTDRDRAAQVAFEQFECRPQALEWIFSVAAGCPFRVSQDNFDARATEPDSFRHQVRAATLNYLCNGIPDRADRFGNALSEVSGCGGFMQHHYYDKLPG
jgi:elongation factor P hydroxylase